MRPVWYKIFTLILVPTLLTGVGLVFFLPSVASASVVGQDAAPTPNPLSIEDSVCLSCHSQAGQTMQLENGEAVDLTVYPQDYSKSIHGELGYACVQCHRTVGNYPHPQVTAPSLREFTISMNKVCSTCHEPQVLLTQDSVHAAALASGKLEAAVCTDCHGAHDVQQWTDFETGKLLQSARLRIPQACANCHDEIYLKYQDSVHGAALYDENNTDVPTCIDCHGVHNIENPTTAAFRLASPEICSKCHTNPQIMRKYGLSTDVLKTYVADFHGTTVTVFEKLSPDAETNKPVCFDCHGIHDIKRVDDPTYGLDIQQNLLVRCQECHPNATINFPSAWLSHYIPSPEKNALVYYVNLFYKFFIPGVLVPMTVLVVLDMGSTIYKKYRKRYSKSAGKDTSDVDALPPEFQSVKDSIQESLDHPFNPQPTTTSPSTSSKDDRSSEEDENE